jgi:16S rRNA (uracil1498-N3)-methyltransferase
MRLTRLYTPQQLQTNQTILLDVRASNHLIRVLRARINDPLIVFDGRGYEFHAELIAIQKNLAQVLIKEAIISLTESPLSIHLGQAISRGEKMDYTLQKAVELGVKTITPIWTEHTGVKLSAERIDNKLTHWQQVIISASEQSGRSVVPSLRPPEDLTHWLKAGDATSKWILHPEGGKRLKDLSPPQGPVYLLVGPEGGFSDQEVVLAQQFGFAVISLGPRILRTETAAPAAIAVIQSLWGDV